MQSRPPGSATRANHARGPVGPAAGTVQAREARWRPPLPPNSLAAQMSATAAQGIQQAQQDLAVMEAQQRSEAQTLEQAGLAGSDGRTSHGNKNFQVVIRVRPPLYRELTGDRPFQNVVRISSDQHEITLSENIAWADQPDTLEGSFVGAYASHQFAFDRIYTQDNSQADVYNTTARAAVLSTLQGYNASIIAYGQTGTGKTYTMEGVPTDPGIIPRAIEEIFSYIKEQLQQPNFKFLVRASYLQIYNENISDLLKPERTHLQIREDKRKGVFVEGMSEWVVRSPEEIYGLMRRGQAVRATGETRMNELSSRSHAVFVVIVEQSSAGGADDDAGNSEGGGSRVRIGKLNLVDLAGSERVRFSGAKGQRLEESKKINQSLSALGNVIAALTDNKKRQHIPYRDSKLTRLLEDSLGGNCKTTMMAMLSPTLDSFAESLSTLKFAYRAKHVRNTAQINQDLDQKALLRKYERELKRLRLLLKEKNREVVDKRKLLELEEQRRRAEADKIEAIKALEQRSREFQAEKEEKRRLEERIAAMEHQVLYGSPAAADEVAKQMVQDYMVRLEELERDRAHVEEDKAQVDRYKQLLLKQRDIMLALTTRLNQRDDTIIGLQEQLDEATSALQRAEEALDEKTARLIDLETAEMAREIGQDPEVALRRQRSATFPEPRTLLERRFPPLAPQTVFGSEGAIAAPSSTLLTADEKVAELSSALEAAGAQQRALSGELDEIRAEKVQMEALLRDKLERMVQSELDERVERYRAEVEEWKKKQLAVLHRASSASETQLRELLASTRSTLAAEKAARTAAEEEAAALRTQLRQQGAAVANGNGTANGDAKSGTAELDRVQLQNRQLKDKLGSVMHQLETALSSGNSAAGGGSDGSSSVSAESIAVLEAKVTNLKRQQAQFRNKVATRLEAKNALLHRYEEENNLLREALRGQGKDGGQHAELLDQISRLRRANDASVRDRRALTALLDKKVKVLVDAVASHASAARLDPAVQRSLSSLQALINASLDALQAKVQQEDNLTS